MALLHKALREKDLWTYVLKGVERGIPIITVDTDVKSSVRKAYVGTDNFYAGQLAGETVIEQYNW